MAWDGWLPKVLAKVSPFTAVPKVAILLICAVTALFAALSFASLAVIVCPLTIASLTLEFLSLIVLRIRCPEAHRPFRVPGGWWGMSYVCLTPLAVAALVLTVTLREWRSYSGQLFVVAAVVLSGVTLYFCRRNIAVPLSGAPVETAASSPSVVK
jgi:amino acid transporter